MISILILTYNRLKISREYIPAILSRAGDAEILICDNGSTDGSADWAWEFGQANEQVSRVFLRDTNIGMEAVNTLAKEASGKYIIKIDDDILPPVNFANRLVDAYEKVNEEKLLFLGWDMPWVTIPVSGGSTFATRSGHLPYLNGGGKEFSLPEGNIHLSYDPSKWMVNGACRLSEREKFLEIGGHPEGILYGVDYHVSLGAKNAGYWIGYFSPKDLLEHCDKPDSVEYRKFKDYELRRAKAPRHV